jgi:RHS repeat-associated protein
MTYGAGTNGTGVGPHQARSIGGAAQTYDANGNLTSGMGRTIAWNNENLPSSVTSNGVAETYGYNADSLRVKKVRSGVTTIYLDGLWEKTSNGTERKFYTLNGQVVAVRTNAGSTNTVSYLHGDHLGSISVTTTASGTAEPRQEFDPWGKVRSGGVTTTTRNYTGQILDDTGLLFYNARYYDPAIGRFISGDTIVPGSNPLTVWPSDAVAGGVWRTQGSGPTDPQQLNRYSYALNNPLRYTDPTGHCVPGTCALTGAAAGGAVAGPAGAVVGGIAGAIADVTAAVLGSAAAVSLVAPALASDDSPVDSVSGAEGLPTAGGATPETPEAPRGPNPHGSRGGPAHRETINQRVRDLEGEGYEHLAGGDLREEYIRIPGGGGRRPDITMRAPDGTMYRENVGRTTATGAPVARERRALDDLERATGTRPGYTGYNRRPQ